MTPDSNPSHSRAWFRALGAMLFVLFVLVVALELQVQQRNRQLNRTERIVTETQAVVNKAVTPTQGQADQAAATAHAIDEINRMAQVVCGGECPPVTTTTTTTP